MNLKLQTHWLGMLSVLLGFFGTHCGGSSVPQGELKNTQPSGIAYLNAPLPNTQIEIYGYAGGVKGTLFGSIATDESGFWKVESELKSAYGPMILEAAADPVPLRALVFVDQPGDTEADISITPITTLAVAYADYLLKSGAKSDLTAAYEKAENLVYQHFGEIDHHSITPTNPNQDSDSLTGDAIAGILIASLERMAKEASASYGVGDLIQQLSDDLQADGVFNGKGSSGPLGLGALTIDGDTLRPFYARKIAEFLDDKTINQTHFTMTDFWGIANDIRTRNSELFESQPNPDSEAPRITIIEPANGAWTKEATITIKGNIESDVLPSLAINGNSVLVSPTGEFNAAMELGVEGANTFLLQARDTLGNETFTTLIVLRDSLPPTIKIESPTSEGLYSLMLSIKAKSNDLGIGVKTISVTGPAEIANTQTDVSAFEGTLDTTALPDGSYTLTFSSEDKAGNKAPDAVVTIYIKNTADLSGTAFKGPLSGSKVKVWDWSAGKKGSELTFYDGNSSEYITDQNGAFDAQLKAHEGPILLEVRDGSYQEEGRAEGFDNPIAFGPDDFLRSVMLHDTPETLADIKVTPFTTLAAILAGKLVESGMEPGLAVSEAKARISGIFKFNMDATPYINFRIAASINFDDSAKAGLLLAGISWMAVENHYYGDLSSVQVLRLLYEDLQADGFLDGIGNAGQELDPTGSGEKKIDAQSLRSTLGRAIFWFLSDPALNQTNLKTSTPGLMQWLDNIALSNDPVFKGVAGIQVDTVAPEITFASPAEGSWVSGQVTVLARATDNDQLADFVVVDGAPAWNSVLIQQSDYWELKTDISTSGLGAITIKVQAKDRSQNVTEKELAFLVDNIPPTTAWIYPNETTTLDCPILAPTLRMTASGTWNDVGSGQLGSVTVNSQTATIDGNTWTVADLPVQEPWTTISVLATDASGNVNSAPRNLTFQVSSDGQAPSIGQLVLDAGRTYNGYVGGVISFHVNSADDRFLSSFLIISPDSVQAALTGNERNKTLATVDLNTDQFGTRSFPITYRAEDASCNVTETTLVLQLENTVPTLTIDFPAEGQELQRHAPCKVNVTGTVSDSGVGLATLYISGSNVSFSNGHWTKEFGNYSSSQNGTVNHTSVHAEATDHVGNIAMKNRNFTVICSENPCPNCKEE